MDSSPQLLVGFILELMQKKSAGHKLIHLNTIFGFVGITKLKPFTKRKGRVKVASAEYHGGDKAVSRDRLAVTKIFPFTEVWLPGKKIATPFFKP